MSYYNIYVIFSLICALLSIFGDKINVGSTDYLVFFLFFIVSIVLFIKAKKFVVPKKYLLLLLLYIIFITINAYVSPYTPGLPYVILGTLITIMPFLVFIVSYNYNFTIDNIYKFIDVWIYFIIGLCVVAYIETPFLSSNSFYNGTILKISIIKQGFFSSLCNQGVILSLYRYSSSHNLKYRKIAYFFSICSILTIQLKVIFGLLVIWVLYFGYISKIKKHMIIIPILMVLSFGILAIKNIPPLSNKVEKYLLLYGGKDSYENVARPALYYQSVHIANDFFPLGSGQGTFGSVPANMLYNQIYYDYNLNLIHGLGESGENYKMDTHWSGIIGENGYLGSLLYFLLFFYSLSSLKKINNSPNKNATKFLILTVYFITFIESITLCIPGRMAFMFIYAGILGLISRSINNDCTNILSKTIISDKK